MSKIETEAGVLWAETTKLLLEDDDVDIIYKRLEGLRVELDSDPLAYGPKRLNHKVAACRKALSEAERIFCDLSQRLAAAKKSLRASTAAYQLAQKYLFANDPEVRAGRNVSDREAFAAIKLKNEWMQVKRLEQTVEDLEAVMTVVRAKRTDLKDTEGRLRDQMRLCQEEIGLGSRWGSKPPPGATIALNPGVGLSGITDMDSVDALVASMNGETHLPVLEDDESVEETPVEEVTQDDPEEVAQVRPNLVDLVQNADPTNVPGVGKIDEFVMPDSDVDDAIGLLLVAPVTVEEVKVEAPEAPALVAETPHLDFQVAEPGQSNSSDLLPGSGSDEDVDNLLGEVEIPQKVSKNTEIDEQSIEELLGAFN